MNILPFTDSFLASLRRQSGSGVSETYQMTTQQRVQQNAHNQLGGVSKFVAPSTLKPRATTIAQNATVAQQQQQQMKTNSYQLHETQEVHRQVEHQTSWVPQNQQQQQLLSTTSYNEAIAVPPPSGAPVDLATVEATASLWYRLKLSRQEGVFLL